jgi:hypothetical protein
MENHMAGSLRDQLEANVEAVEEAVQQEVVESGAVSPEATSTPAEAAPIEEKPGRTAGRARDEHGKLLPGKAVRQENSAATPNAVTPIRAPEQASQAVAADTPKPQRPSSWKKEHWEHFDQLAATNPALAAYINQRESEYAKGVSTYRAEAENAKPILEAITPFMPALQANNVKPEQWIQQLGTAHQTLVYGAPQQKAAMFAQMMQQYRIDPSMLFVKGEDGNVYINPQLSQAAPQRQQAPQPDVRSIVQEALSEERARSEVERMRSDTKSYPHFETVRATMVGLLQSGLATDYDEAYHAAIRHPRHSDIFEAQQQQQRQQEAEKAAEEKRKAAEAARRNAVSPRTSTPTAAAAGTNGKKGLRDQLSENLDAALGGRV